MTTHISIVSTLGSLRWWDADGPHHYQGRVIFKSRNGFRGFSTKECHLNLGDGPWNVTKHKVKSPNSKARVVCINFDELGYNGLYRIQFTAAITDLSDDGQLLFLAVKKAETDCTNYT